MDSSTSFDLVIRGDLVLPERVLADGYIAIRGETIAALGAGEPPPAARVDDFRGHLLMPGLVDAQVHSGSYEGLEGLRDATRSAAAGGVTTIVDMPFDDPAPVDDAERLAHKIGKVGELAAVDVGLYVTAKKGGDPNGLREMAELGACGVKVSTYEYHPVRFPRFTTGEMFDIFNVAAGIGLPVAFHNEDQELVDHLLAKTLASGDRSPAAHGAARPPLAEIVANAQILELASHTGVRIHIVHSSVAAGFEMAARHRERGLKVSVETCLQYFIFNEDDMARRGAFLKQNPPLRAEAERQALWRVLERGEVDLVSTDHVAWPAERKSDPDIFKNGSGVPGLEALLPVFYSACTERGLSPCRVAEVCALNPAKHFGFYPRKGHLGVGADADIAVLRLGEGSFDQARIVSKVGWSPYHGQPLRAAVAATYLRGRKVYEGGTVLAEPGTGRFIAPSREASR